MDSTIYFGDDGLRSRMLTAVLRDGKSPVAVPAGLLLEKGRRFPCLFLRCDRAVLAEDELQQAVHDLQRLPC